MKNIYLPLWILAGFSVFALTGCVTSGVMNPDIPITEQCVLVKTGNVNATESTGNPEKVP